MSGSKKPLDGQPTPEERDDASSTVDAEEVVRHRIVGHRAALDIADRVGQPETLAPYVRETQHRLAEAEDILDEISPEDDPQDS